MKIGFLQNSPEFGNVTGNLDRIESILSGHQADLTVLPELFATGYQFTSAQETHDLAEPIPDGNTTKRILKWAQELKCVIVAGLVECNGDSVYNSAVVAGPEGFIGSYRKAHLFDKEKKIFCSGNDPFPVFDIGLAKVGVMICFDWWFPETCRTLALKGAEIIAHPSNLVLPHCPQSMITRCLENRIFAVTANRIGTENRFQNERLEFIGQSQVVDPNGCVLRRASRDNENISFVEIDPAQAQEKSINPNNNILIDRRTDLYDLN